MSRMKTSEVCNNKNNNIYDTLVIDLYYIIKYKYRTHGSILSHNLRLVDI